MLPLFLFSANVLLDLSFRAKVGDFGLVRAIGHDPHGQIKQSHTARIVGTSGYIAPEYFRGKITTKLDTYAFGVVSYTLRTPLYVFLNSLYDSSIYKKINYLRKKRKGANKYLYLGGAMVALPNLVSFNGKKEVFKCKHNNYYYSQICDFSSD